MAVSPPSSTPSRKASLIRRTTGARCRQWAAHSLRVRRFRQWRPMSGRSVITARSHSMSVDVETGSDIGRERPRHPMSSARRALKIGVIGAGAVGCACLLATVMRGCAREIVLVNRNRKRAKGVVSDMQYGTVLSPATDVYDGEYADLAGAALVMITAGVNEKAGGATDRNDPAGRLRLLDTNAELYRDIVAKIATAAPQAIILVVTDPPDPLADLARLVAGHERVLSAGTFLDSLRFRFHLARRLKVSPTSVDAQV